MLDAGCLMLDAEMLDAEAALVDTRVNQALSLSTFNSSVLQIVSMPKSTATSPIKPLHSTPMPLVVARPRWPPRSDVSTTSIQHHAECARRTQLTGRPAKSLNRGE